MFKRHIPRPDRHPLPPHRRYSPLLIPSPSLPPPKLTSPPSPVPTVWIKVGVCTPDSIINILLCTLGFIPGLLHAWYIIAKYPEPDDSQGYEPIDGGESRVAYYYVDPRQSQQPQPQSAPQRGYGTQHQGHQGAVIAGGSQPLQQPGGQWHTEGGDGGVPPSYEQAVKGDHKVQN